MHLYSNHPRFTISIIVLVFISVMLFANLNKHERLLRVGFAREDALAQSVAAEELHYRKMLEHRRELIERWGPTAGSVDPFPHRDRKPYTMWDFFLPSFNCPHRVQRVGVMGDGGKWVCGLERIAPKKTCVIYSFGIANESSFEADFLKAAPGCELYGYDYSVDSFGPEIERDSELKSRAQFFPYSLGHEDRLGPLDHPKMYTLHTLMEQNAHDFIDVLKIDVEGSEFKSLAAFINNFQGEPLPVGQLQLEVHVFGNGGWESFAKFLHWWEILEEAGLRPFFSEPNLVYVNMLRARPDLVEYSFLNIRGSHELVSDRPVPHNQPVPHVDMGSLSRTDAKGSV